ncbi:MAG: DUF4912 domain-containing protein [Planctomycetes bacterium]|nr:DUF4912 domain-containing protein [Planctomycetota bacterium]
MITVANLRTQSVKDLTAMARKMGVTGVRAMRKEQLVRAVVKASKAKSSGSSQRKTLVRSGKRRTLVSARAPVEKTRDACLGESGDKRGNGSRSRGKSCTLVQQQDVAGVPHDTARPGNRSVGEDVKIANPRVLNKLRRARLERLRLKDLANASALAAKNSRKPKNRKLKRSRTPVPGKDRVVLLVRDPYWLQACWDVSRQSVARAKAAMAEQWHLAEPVLRLLEVDSGPTTSTTERVVREIRIHGGVRNWYIDVKDSPNSFRVDLGYLGEGDRFYSLARSNVVTTPQPGSSDAIDENWSDIAENYEKIYALSGGYESTGGCGDLQELFEERLRRPMTNPAVSPLDNNTGEVLQRDRDFQFDVDAEVIVFGSTKPNAHVTLAGQPVRLRSDGTFTVRLSMPDRRQLLPVVANSRDGSQQRTIVLAIERNTKVLEPLSRDEHE